MSLTTTGAVGFRRANCRRIGQVTPRPDCCGSGITWRSGRSGSRSQPFAIAARRRYGAPFPANLTFWVGNDLGNRATGLSLVDADRTRHGRYRRSSNAIGIELTNSASGNRRVPHGCRGRGTDARGANGECGKRRTTGRRKSKTGCAQLKRRRPASQCKPLPQTVSNVVGRAEAERTTYGRLRITELPGLNVRLPDRKRLCLEREQLDPANRRAIHARTGVAEAVGEVFDRCGARRLRGAYDCYRQGSEFDRCHTRRFGFA